MRTAHDERQLNRLRDVCAKLRSAAFDLRLIEFSEDVEFEFEETADALSGYHDELQELVIELEERDAEDEAED